MINGLISVIIPVYNLKNEIGAMLDCLLRQTYPHMEIIAVDDGSTDGSGELLDSYAARFPNVRVLHKPNGGIMSARFAGLRVAEGEWIGSADGDDTLDPDMFERLIRNAEKYGAEISHCGYRVYEADGREVRYFGTGVLLVQDRLEALKELLSFERVKPEFWTKLIHRPLFDSLLQEKEKLGNIRFNEDTLMNYILFSACKRAVFEDFCPYVYKVQAESVSHGRLNMHRIYDRIRVKELILERAPEELLPLARRAYMSSCVASCNEICVAKEKEFMRERPHLRKLLLEHRAWFPELGRKRRALACLICFAPGLYPPLYRLYAKRFKKDSVY